MFHEFLFQAGSSFDRIAAWPDSNAVPNQCQEYGATPFQIAPSLEHAELYGNQ